MKGTLMLIFAVAVCYSGCSDSGVPTKAVLDSSVNGRKLDYPQEYSFALDLDVHADGGYQWECQLSNASSLSLDSTRFRPKQEPKQGGPIMVGGLTVETFHFRTIKEGECTVTLKERRVWENDVPPIQTLQFIVSVHE
jgi:predicted secreted protein